MSIERNDIIKAIKIKKELFRRRTGRNFKEFVMHLQPTYQMTWYHEFLCEKYQAFAEGRIRKMMVFLPPQHGKSELNSRKLPAFLLGNNPDLKIALAAYNSTFASKFNIDIQRIITHERYKELYPKVRLNERNIRTLSGSWLRNSDEFEIVDHEGAFISVGVQGALTGRKIDIGIIDDVYKDAMDAYSSTVRESISSWYWSVFNTRLHNDSQRLITFTRWHPEDLAAEILSKEDDWEVITLPAIKEDELTPYDTRKIGEALWEKRQSLARLREVEKNNPVEFRSLYQQDPKPQGAMPFSKNELQYFYQEEIIDSNNTFAVCDPADTGNDYLCFLVCKKMGDKIYILDAVYTNEPIEYSTPKILGMIYKYTIPIVQVESNSSGRLFGMRLAERISNNQCKIYPKATTENKEARIQFAVSDIKYRCFFNRSNNNFEYIKYISDLCNYSLTGKNKTDDAADCTTMAVEYVRQTNIKYTWS